LHKSRWNSPILIMPVLLVLWGSYAAVSKMATSRLDSFQVLFYTFGISCLMFTIMLIANGRIKSVLSLTLRDGVRLLATGLPFYLYFLLYSLSMNRIPVVEASMLNYLFPVFIVLLSIPLFGERLSLVKGLSILFAWPKTLNSTMLTRLI
jgi:drug/metabolite transporter (DMT)-like permease